MSKKENCAEIQTIEDVLNAMYGKGSVTGIDLCDLIKAAYEYGYERGKAANNK